MADVQFYGGQIVWHVSKQYIPIVGVFVLPKLYCDLWSILFSNVYMPYEDRDERTDDFCEQLSVVVCKCLLTNMLRLLSTNYVLIQLHHGMILIVTK